MRYLLEKLACLLIVFVSLSTPLAAQGISDPFLKSIFDATAVSSQCSNKSFEAGTTDWQIYSGLTTNTFGGNYRSGLVPTTGCSEGTYGASCHMLESTPIDGNIPGLPKFVHGGQSLRLGGNNLNMSTGYVIQGASKRFFVVAGKEIYKFRFASVMQQAHDVTTGYTGTEPYFEAIAIDATTGAVIDTFVQPSSGYNLNTVPHPSGALVRYIPWTCAQLDLTGHVGKEVIVYLTSADCGAGGHASYSYIDDTCSDCEVKEEPEASIEIDPQPAQCSANGDVTISGKYEIPDEFNQYSPSNIKVTLDAYSGGTMSSTITSSTVSGGSYNFVVTNSSLPPSGCFDIVATLTFDIKTPSGITRTETVKTPVEGQTAGSDNDICVDCEQQTQVKPCTPFEADPVQCNATLGVYTLKLTNLLEGDFDPELLEVTSQTPGVTLIQDPQNPLEMAISGASPGDKIIIKTSARDIGAGDGAGLDMCCMGEMEIEIPDDLPCDAIDVSLDVIKYCIPSPQAAQNQSCHIVANYSGPPPSPSNPIWISEALNGASNWNITSYPSGTGDFDCSSTPLPHSGPAPLQCVIDGSTTPANTDWSNYSTNFWIELSAGDATENCVDLNFEDFAGTAHNEQACVPLANIDNSDSSSIDVSITKNWVDFLDDRIRDELNPAHFHGFLMDVNVVSGTLTPGDVITVSDPISGQTDFNQFGPVVGQSPWQCSMNGMDWTCTYTVPANGTPPPSTIFWPTDLGAPDTNTSNCASVSVMSGNTLVPDTDTTNNNACWSEQIDTPEVLEIEKTGPAQCRTGETCTFTYIVNNRGSTAYNGPITLSDEINLTSTASSFGSSGGNFISITPALCDPADLESQAGCTGSTYIAVGGTVAYTVEYAPPMTSGEGDFTLENCVSLLSASSETSDEANTACHQVELLEPRLEIVKTGPDVCPQNAPCDFNIVITNTSSSPYSGPVFISDSSTIPGHNVTAVTPMPTGCGGNLPAQMFNCVTNVTNLAPSASLSYVVTMSPPPNGTVVPDTGENCALLTAAPDTVPTGDYSLTNLDDLGPDTVPPELIELFSQALPIGSACSYYTTAIPNIFTSAENEPESEEETKPEELTKPEEPTKPTEQTDVKAPILVLEKSSSKACIPNVAAQSYSCDFNLKISNTGGAVFQGPMVVNDSFGNPKPRQIQNVTGNGWSCVEGSDGASCINGALNLAPGASSEISMQLILPGLEKGGVFENCGTLGLGDDPIQQAKVAQTAMNLLGFDVGEADGKIGKNTRNGLVKLQEQLGIEASGELSSEFFEAIGVSMASDNAPSCVSVQLSPMPKPKIICEAATTTPKGGACACRFKNMYMKGNKRACGCIKGTRFVAGEGCIRVAAPKPQCERATTVLKGNACLCRFKNMYKKKSKKACGCVKGTRFVAGKGCIRKEGAKPKPEPRQEPKQVRKCPRGTLNVKGICIKLDLKLGRPKKRKPTGNDCVPTEQNHFCE